MSATIGNTGLKMISEEEVFRYFGSMSGGRGDVEQRQKHVTSVMITNDGKALLGKVQAGQEHYYMVRVTFSKGCSAIDETSCSCAVRMRCKHAAAVILHTLRTTPELISSMVVVPSAQGMEPNHSTDEYRWIDNSSGKLSNDTVDVDVIETVASVDINADTKISARTNDWLRNLKVSLAPVPDKVDSDRNVDSITYILKSSHDGKKLSLNTYFSRKLNGGGWAKGGEIDLYQLKGGSYARSSKRDADIAGLFLGAKQNSSWSTRKQFPDSPELCKFLIKLLVETGRCFFEDLINSPLTMGGSKDGNLEWVVQPSGKQVLRLTVANQNVVTFQSGILWYVDISSSTIGEVTLPVPLQALQTILSAPPIEPDEAAAASKMLRSLGSLLPLPREIEVEIIEERPKVSLHCNTVLPWSDGSIQGGYSFGDRIPVASLLFNYKNDLKFKDSASEARSFDGEKLVVHKRSLEFETNCLELLKRAGLSTLEHFYNTYPMLYFPKQIKDSWFSIVRDLVPILESDGWTVTFDRGFPYQIVFPEEEWALDATEGSDFWFSMRLDIVIDGKKIPLLPILHEALRGIKGLDTVAAIESMNVNGTFYAPLQDGRKVALEFARVQSIIEVLVELFNQNYSGKKGAFEIPLPQAVGLLSRLQDNRCRWNAPKRLRELIEKFASYQGAPEVRVPQKFGATLRPYQSEGLSWLDFIRDLGLGGILADDMGLGKTVQTLAHFAVECDQKRATKPFLVVCPTSVLPNWASEIKKFAPFLKTVSLWGPDRALRFKKIARSQIVLTTYPLLVRDQETLIAQKWQAVVLDEAQMVKNPETIAAQVIRKLKSDYRLCLTGTPVENNLSEIWAQFDFLMPGFLGDQKAFRTNFRTPIEKQKDKFVQNALASRMKPFLLRRTKELVAKDLPEKTIITKEIELSGAQRDLYETVRLAMYEKVKEALASKGMAKSHIIVLDALLKLRQVCCDPRLVALPAAKKVKSSAKLEALLEMLEELASEGRRILLFSQFTSMLDIIIPELNKRKIQFVEIRGTTKDRQTPVQQFQAGKVPLFLLSLKAGGLGLNLTAADTVIHYDPWWNPAVENQATDRAYRIGQKQNVFVFKMIASGTIEERMLELQERKRVLAAGIYTDDCDDVGTMLSVQDVHALFQPI